MCMDPSHTGFYRVVQKVSDVIPVLYFVVYRFCFPERRRHWSCKRLSADSIRDSIRTEISDCRSLLFDPPPCEICMFVCLFGQRFLSNPRADSRQILHAGVAWVGTCLLPFWGSATPWGQKVGKWHGGGPFVHRTATISIFLSDAKCRRQVRSRM